MNKKVIWIKADRLHQYVDISRNNIVPYLTAFHEMAGTRAVHITKHGLLLNKKYLPIFANQFGLVRFDNLPEKDEHWNSVFDLCSVFHRNVGVISNALWNHKDDPDMCDDNGNKLIQFRRTAHNRYISLCLFNSTDAKRVFAEKMGWQYMPLRRYKMQYNWTNRRKFSDNEIHETVMRLLKKGDVYESEYECADALLSELPKRQSSEDLLLVEIPEQTVVRAALIRELKNHGM